MLTLEGHAIVSADGMIAEANGLMPAALRNDTDWRLFQAALDRAALVVLGRVGHEWHPNPGRPRLVVTGRVADLASDPADSLATLWNPAGITFEAVLDRLGIAEGVIAITGGTHVFDLFLLRYTSFVLSEVSSLVLPGGRATFTAGHPRAVLAAAGLKPVATDLVDSAANVTLTRWSRAPRKQETD